MNNKKLNTGKAEPKKKGGIIAEKTDRPTEQELKELVDRYNALTAEIDDEKAMEMMDTKSGWHYLMLLKIADHRPMGKTFAILKAYELGYLAAQGKVEVGGWLPDEAENGVQVPDERKEVIAELLKEIEDIHNIAKIRFILGIVRSYKKGGE